MKTIYTALIEELKKVTQIKWIDLDTGQMNNSERPAIAFPAALIEIGVPRCENYSDLSQYCTAKIGVRLIFDTKGARTAANVSENDREKSLEIYDVISDVYAKLQGFETENFNALARTSQGKESNNNYFVYKIDFECEYEDNTAL